ncbi:protein arginine N-methyltransferase 7-like, partial [Diadema antillarum]|uniref:protein arginine N-methyltransferase 7-like n=1 Tax=Diadema antillarum TaxID=105358 RepID=UPI003A83FDD1
MVLPPMSSHVNPTTGAAEWVVEDESYDFHQEIARSTYTDMLHDDERNKKYYEGIKRAVAIIRERGQEVRVLDIGTGTGLLAMMAASCGADSVHACEAFTPIAEAAKKIIAKNGFRDKITVIPKRSTEVTVGQDGDMPARANILAAEVFDTELIGEGAVPTYLHAHRHLLTDDCICVPHSATVFAQVVQSDIVWRWHKLQPIKIPGRGDIIPHPEMDSCAGAASVHDLQLSQLSPDQFCPITDPHPMIGFNFTKGDFSEHRANSVTSRSLLTGECQVMSSKDDQRILSKLKYLRQEDKALQDIETKLKAQLNRLKQEERVLRQQMRQSSGEAYAEAAAARARIEE